MSKVSTGMTVDDDVRHDGAAAALDASWHVWKGVSP